MTLKTLHHICLVNTLPQLQRSVWLSLKKISGSWIEAGFSEKPDNCTDLMYALTMQILMISFPNYTDVASRVNHTIKAIQ